MLTAGKTFKKFGAIPLYNPRNPSSLTICLANGINPPLPTTVTEKKAMTLQQTIYLSNKLIINITILLNRLSLSQMYLYSCAKPTSACHLMRAWGTMGVQDINKNSRQSWAGILNWSTGYFNDDDDDDWCFTATCFTAYGRLNGPSDLQR